MTAYEVILGYYKIAVALDQLATTDEQIAEVENINNTLNENVELI